MFSPTSISIALAMLYNGAANETATAIATALHFTLPLDRLNAAFDAVDLALTTPPADAGAGAFQLSVANSTLDAEGLPHPADLSRQPGGQFGSGVDQVDFMNAPEAARAAINSWVSDETQGEIPTSSEGGPLSATRLVLADAVYFHGDWRRRSPRSARTARSTPRPVT